jgi:hypothetical protein
MEAAKTRCRTMSAQALLTRNRRHNVVYSLKDLPRDFKRVLRVQMKEFLHYLDESRESSKQPRQRKNIA